MKIRNGFISNSSSTSFVVKNSIENLGIDIGFSTYIEIPKEYRQSIIEKLIKDHNKEHKHIEIKDTDKLYLTSYISDSGDVPDESDNCYSYNSGDHGGPYYEEDEIEIAENIWVCKEEK